MRNMFKKDMIIAQQVTKLVAFFMSLMQQKIAAKLQYASSSEY
jgi:hypothetical protein